MADGIMNTGQNIITQKDVPNLLLIRGVSTENGTFGELLWNNKPLRPICLTLERPWLDNKPEISSIPPGTYGGIRRKSPRFGIELFILKDVPGRSYIELHPANIYTQLEGCIALGLRYGFPTEINGKPNKIPGLLESRLAFAKFMNLMDGHNEIILTIRNA